MNAPTQTLHTELAEAYRLLAEWQAKHRTAFPSHRVAIELTCSPPAPDLSEFGVSISVMRDGPDPEQPELLVFVHGYEPTPRLAAEAAILGADTNVSEGAAEWSRT